MLHRCSAETLLELCKNKKYLGVTPGIIQILHTWRNKLYSTDWNAEIKKTFNGNGNAIEYLGRHANRIAITNARIISVNEKEVSFHAKDYRTNKQNKQSFIFLLTFYYFYKVKNSVQSSYLLAKFPRLGTIMKNHILSIWHVQISCFFYCSICDTSLKNYSIGKKEYLEKSIISPILSYYILINVYIWNVSCSFWHGTADKVK